jgi:hypothetical protein
MTTQIAPPPVRSGTGLSFTQNRGDAQIHFYIDYEYLPLRQICSLIKEIDELYELIYFILHDETAPHKDRLVLDHVATTNSLDAILKLFERLRPSSKAIKALLITGALLSSPFAVEEYRDTRAERMNKEAFIAKTEAESENINANTRKIKAEAESIELDNKLKKMKINKLSKEKLTKPENQKKIVHQTTVIKQTVIINNTVNFFTVNDVEVYNRNKE